LNRTVCQIDRDRRAGISGVQRLDVVGDRWVGHRRRRDRGTGAKHNICAGRTSCARRRVTRDVIERRDAG